MVGEAWNGVSRLKITVEGEYLQFGQATIQVDGEYIYSGKVHGEEIVSDVFEQTATSATGSMSS